MEIGNAVEGVRTFERKVVLCVESTKGKAVIVKSLHLCMCGSMIGPAGSTHQANAVFNADWDSGGSAATI